MVESLRMSVIHAILAVEYINSQYEREARLKKREKKKVCNILNTGVFQVMSTGLSPPSE